MAEKTELAAVHILESRAVAAVPQVGRNTTKDLPITDHADCERQIVRKLTFAESEKIVLDRPYPVAMITAIEQNTNQN